MKKTLVYIDGYNLYYGLLKGSPSSKWLNLRALASAMFKEKHEILSVKYFTARVRTYPHDAAAEERRLKENLLARIEKTVGDDGKIYTCDFTSRTEQNILTVTAKAVCLEKISVTAELAAPY